MIDFAGYRVVLSDIFVKIDTSCNQNYEVEWNTSCHCLLRDASTFRSFLRFYDTTESEFVDIIKGVDFM